MLLQKTERKTHIHNPVINSIDPIMWIDEEEYFKV
jgi:hypothetical protein